ncbi:regulator of Ty1 Transposition [Coemansia thaxteri]|nr:regulator of Ty1 Transposition [Coemansia thaxteri]
MTGEDTIAPVAEQVVLPAVELSEAEQQCFARYFAPVFKDVVYWINPIYGAVESERIAQQLAIGGGRPATIRRHGRSVERDGTEVQRLNGVLVRALPQMASHLARFYLASSGSASGEDGVQRVTHVISPDTHFGEYQTCARAGVCVVTSLWVDRSLQSGWRYVERFFSAKARDIFSGMVVTATHMPVADKETLLASVMALGGQWREKMRADVTHLILMKDVGPKYEFAQRHSELGIRPILPHWFKETLNLLHCVSQEPYLFPNPPMLDGKISREAARPEDIPPLAVPSADTHTGSAYELPKPSEAFMRGYVVAIDTQLRDALTEGAVARLSQRLEEAGAVVAEPLAAATRTGSSSKGELVESRIADWDSVDILVCQYRIGYDYSKASRLGKMVGTLVWLYRAFITQRLTAPTQRLLDYPMPLHPVAGMTDMVITVSHYTGASREYLRRLITAMGAQYTAKMTKRNTHLITASQEGRKYAAAISWNVDVVNHLWVEQCYQRWKVLTVSHPNFTHFPDLPMLNSMVGSTEINVGKLKAWVDVPQGESLAEWSDMDVLSDGELDETPAPAIAAAIAGNGAGEEKGEAMAADLTEDKDDNDESGQDVKSIGDSADEQGDVGMREGDEMAALSLGQRRHTSRAAAMAASKSLSVIMQAVNSFEADMRKEQLHKYRRNLVGRRSMGAGGDEETGRDNGVAGRGKRGEELGSGAGEEEVASSKRRRTMVDDHGRQRPAVRILFTVLRPTEEQYGQIAEMGGAVVQEVRDATHLVCEKVRRTEKFLLALPTRHIWIVGCAWLNLSLAQRRWVEMDPAKRDPDAAKCQLVDRDAERTWRFRLEEAIQRARARRLLEGVTVFITPTTKPGLRTLKPLIEMNGGSAVEHLEEGRLKALIDASLKVVSNKSIAKDRIPPLLVLSCMEDSHMWKGFETPAGYMIPIYPSEVMLTGLLRQQILRDEDILNVKSNGH